MASLQYDVSETEYGAAIHSSVSQYKVFTTATKTYCCAPELVVHTRINHALLIHTVVLGFPPDICQERKRA